MLWMPRWSVEWVPFDAWTTDGFDRATVLFELRLDLLRSGDWIAETFDACIPDWREELPSLALHHEEQEYPELLDAIRERPDCCDYLANEYGPDFLDAVEYGLSLNLQVSGAEITPDAFAAALIIMAPAAAALAPELDGAVCALIAANEAAETTSVDVAAALLAPAQVTGELVAHGEQFRGLALLLHDLLKRGYFSAPDQSEWPFWHEFLDAVWEQALQHADGPDSHMRALASRGFDSSVPLAERATRIQTNLLRCMLDLPEIDDDGYLNVWEPVERNDRFRALGEFLGAFGRGSAFERLCMRSPQQGLRVLRSIAVVAGTVRALCYAEGGDPGAYDDHFVNYGLGEAVCAVSSALLDVDGELDQFAAEGLFVALASLRSDTLSRYWGPGDWLDRLNGALFNLAHFIPGLRARYFGEASLQGDPWFSRDRVQEIIAKWSVDSAEYA